MVPANLKIGQSGRVLVAPPHPNFNETKRTGKAKAALEFQDIESLAHGHCIQGACDLAVLAQVQDAEPFFAHAQGFTELSELSLQAQVRKVQGRGFFHHFLICLFVLLFHECRILQYGFKQRGAEQAPDTDRVTGDDVQVRALEGGVEYYGTAPFVKVQLSSS